MVVTGSHKHWPAHLLANSQIDRTGARRVLVFIMVGTYRHSGGRARSARLPQWPAHLLAITQIDRTGTYTRRVWSFRLVGTYRHFWWTSACLPQLAPDSVSGHFDIFGGRDVRQWLATTPTLPAPLPEQQCATLVQQRWHYPGSQSPTHNAYTRMVTAA